MKDYSFDRIEQPKIESGDFLILKEDLHYIFKKPWKKGERLQVVTIVDLGVINKDEIFISFEDIEKHFTVEKPTLANTDTSYTKNEKVLVRNSETDEWQERLFVIEHEGLYFCAIETHAGLEPFRFIKPYEKEEKEKVIINAEYLWVPEKGEKVLAFDGEWFIGKFICGYKSQYLIEVEAGDFNLFKKIKPYEQTKEDTLRPQLDELIEAYAKEGIKLTPHFEKI
jgi:hypothetical protein